MIDSPINKRQSLGALVISASLLVGTAINEGYTSRAVQPLPGDKLTIGFGNTAGVAKNSVTTPVRSLITLENDLEGRKAAIAKCVHVPLYQYELDAYMDFAYNVGTSAFCKSTLVIRLNTQNYAGACNELKLWTQFHGKYNAALAKRRDREYNTCMGFDTIRTTNANP